jgi:alcohol dehydrogenase class IV
MLVDFEFAMAGRIIAGPGRAAEPPGVVAGLGSRVLVCTGASPARHGSLLAGLRVPAAVFPVAGEPTVELARAGVAAAREHGADVVAAIGGGSVIDVGKTVAMLLGNGGDPLDYLEVVGSGQQITQPAVPCVAVPATAGTGAEVTANAVLASPAHGVKDGRSASTSCRADAAVKQIKSITTSGRRAAIRAPKVPSASSRASAPLPASRITTLPIGWTNRSPATSVLIERAADARSQAG